MNVCLVIPCFNEEKRLPVAELRAFVAAHPEVSLCLVDDGSVDGTKALLEQMKNDCPARIMVLNLGVNSGKAEAVRQGMLHALEAQSFNFIGYWDADLSTPLHELWGILAAFEINPVCRLAMGARFRRVGSNIDRRFTRRVLGRVFSLLATLTVDLPIHDSQCGAKVLRADIVDLVFGDAFISRWLFDVEILARLRARFGRDEVLKTVVEVPLGAWREVGGSKLRLSHMARAPLDLLRIHSHYGKAR